MTYFDLFETIEHRIELTEKEIKESEEPRLMDRRMMLYSRLDTLKEVLDELGQAMDQDEWETNNRKDKKNED